MVSKYQYERILYPVIIIISLTALLISRLLYPPTSSPFSDVWDTISGLGSVGDNPFGFYGFQISMVLIGVAILPIFLYVHPKILHINDLVRQSSKKKNFVYSLMTYKIIVQIGSIWLFIGAIGFLLTGLVPDETFIHIHKFHEITSGFGFLGVLFASFNYYFTLREAGKVGNFVSQKLLLFVTIVWWIGIILTAISYTIATVYYEPLYNLGWYGPEWGTAGVSFFYSFAVWERVLFSVTIFYAGLLQYIIPSEIKTEIIQKSN